MIERKNEREKSYDTQISFTILIKVKLMLHPHHKDLSNKTLGLFMYTSYLCVPALTTVLTLSLNCRQHHETLTIPTMLLTAFVRWVWEKRKQNFSGLFLRKCWI